VHASLGMTRLRQKRFDDAKEQLRQAVAAGAQNYLAHYYYAYVLSRAGMDETGRVNGYDAETLRAMRASLLKSIELKPDFPESYHLLAFVDLVTGDKLDEGVQMLSRARALSPGNGQFAFVLAQIYLRQEKYDDALKTLAPLAHDNADPQMRANAQSLLASIETVQEQAARYKAAREAYEKGGGDAGGPPRLMRRGDGDASAGAQGRQADRSDEELASDAFSSALNDALRKPLAGETRARGVLTRIECSARGIVFVVRVGESLLRLSVKSFDEVHIMAFTPEAGGELTCGPRKTESPVVVTYRAATDARAKTDGAITALEFVPANFQLKQ